MKKLTIVAKITAKPGKADEVKSELQKIIEPTRVEKGCINYDLHKDNKDPNVFLFYENWESYDLWQDHMKSEHLAAMKKSTEEIIENIDIYEMTPVDIQCCCKEDNKGCCS